VISLLIVIFLKKRKDNESTYWILR
jgi:hypothetical protein